MTDLGVAVMHQISADDALPALMERIRQLQANGRRALVITVLHPVTTLQETLEGVGGVDADQIAFIDCTGESQHDEPGDDILFVESPSMVEAILVRTDRLLRRMGDDVGVIVHTLDAFTLYSPPRLVADFAHALVNNLRGKGRDVEFLAVQGEATSDVARRIEALVDGGAQS